MRKYKEFIQLIKEGLIRTHNIYNYSSSLENNIIFLGFDIKLNIISKFRYEITIYNPEHFELTDEIEDLFFSINNNYGYYPIRFTPHRKGNNKSNILKFEEEIFKKEINNKLINYVTLMFDAKYDDSLYSNTNQVPNNVYHLSPSKNKNNILKNGFYPKSNQRKVNHRDRLYIFTNYNDYSDILKSLKIDDIMNSNKRTYDLYEIKMNNKNILHTDPDSNGIFTYDHISPKSLKILLANI